MMAAATGKAFPRNLFLAAVAAVCLGLAFSAAYSYLTLARMREEYLSNRGREIAALLDSQLRGPSRRNPDSWQEILGNTLPQHQDMLAFLALVDQDTRVLARAGEEDPSILTSPAGFLQRAGGQVYILDISVMSPQRAGQGMGMPMGTHAGGWRIRVGVQAASADFIRHQALVQLGVAAVAIAALLALACYFLHVLGRFLVLKTREESDRRLAALGTLSATLAHEIRNPLGAVKGLTQLAQEELPKEHPAQALMQTVVSEAERLERLVSDLLGFARRRDPSMKRFDYAGLLRQVRDGLSPQLEAAGVELVLPANVGPLAVQGDEDGLRQVLMNVLLNAIEASPAGGRISVEIHADRSSKQLRAEIDDQGSGLGERNPEELFEPFITTKTRGTGLGLPVSRQILESMSGEISLASLPGGGARCTIGIPWESA